MSAADSGCSSVPGISGNHTGFRLIRRIREGCAGWPAESMEIMVVPDIFTVKLKTHLCRSADRAERGVFPGCPEINRILQSGSVIIVNAGYSFS